MATGGKTTGGTPTGGMATGGMATGGMATGGKATGGTPTGGAGGYQIGTTNPASAIQLPGDYFTSGTLHGSCYTYADSRNTTNPGTSTETPPCNGGACFNSTTGMCIAGTTGICSATDNYASWGVGLGCNVNVGSPLSIAGKTSINLTVYGNTMPTTMFQIGVTVTNPPALAGGGTANVSFCYAAALTSGTRISIPLVLLTSPCWTDGGPAFDPSTMTISDVVVGVRAANYSAMPYDLCISELSIT
jgi:hypothetical protein